MTESSIQALIMRELTKDPRCRLFRNNVGIGWAGQLVRKYPDGSVLLAHARPLHAGLCVGAADLIGWSAGRFLSVEVKTPTGAIRPEQITWRDNVLRAGGIAGIVRSVEEAKELIR